MHEDDVTETFLSEEDSLTEYSLLLSENSNLGSFEKNQIQEWKQKVIHN